MTIDTWGSDASMTVTQTTTIANGAAVSSATIPQQGMHLIGISFPAAWTAASLTFQTVSDGGTAQNLYDANGAEVTITPPAAGFAGLNVAVPPLTLGRAWSGLIVRSGTSATPVNQGAQRVVTLVFGRYL